ncbi:MAG TPA: RNA polymerase sigma factor [Chitinophagaceae bacterium]|nr:RNA polymerase sigma factor [Chitinophagaceae bacterium]
MGLSKTGNKDDFIKLVNENSNLIHKVCYLYCQSVSDRQDLFQEIVIQLWKAYGSFRGESKFSTWLYRIALNTAISAYRKSQKNIFVNTVNFFPEELPDVVFDYEKEEKLKQLYTAVSRLTEIEKAIVMLYLDDKSYEEMESILGINQNTLRVKMSRIKDKLRQLIQNETYGAK